MEISDLEPLLREKIEVDERGCWIWIAARDAHGYGRVNRKIGDKWLVRFSHRVVYGLLVGDPGDRPLDHLCRVTSCCNPDHLEPTTHIENVRRGASGVTQRRRFAEHRFCPKGHPLFGDNLYAYTTREGWVNKQCRTCRRDRARKLTRKWTNAA